MSLDLSAVAEIPVGAGTAKVRRRRRRSPRQALVERVVGLTILVLAAVAFVVVPLVSTASPTALADLPQQSPSAAHWFGTDSLGRDSFVRVFAAGWTDLLITVLAVTICLIAGTVSGVGIAACPGPIRSVVLRLIDALLAIPHLIVVLALIVLLGQQQLIPLLPASASSIVIAIVMVGWAPYARLTVTQALVLRERESVVSARLLGYSRARILLRHTGPAMMGVNLSYAATQAVLTTGVTASLAFLGAGVPEPTPELGMMMQQGVALLPTTWWITVIPGLFVLVLGIGFALVADSIDPQGAA
ncbi:peptide/nickel transport system permease protein [Amycolatopsis bartoniae]|uniref:Nickel ABC transporter permease n=1 Tax=Amycolatopsis bartoniae TaxID=941986 RepID=A0A8H9IX11_9PSEU|nr:ABC transporter permease [Amycolatopsis bartoniae]MBB2933460.1 peptide/nickel transport system permease protein [Amycolatopsis bartoniae]TVT00406.1 ABC transporter permease [Amycolatopsis bartoniae]GHF59611.1 nickel ABC transporter permease [Amycolatopsis bartoniae]